MSLDKLDFESFDLLRLGLIVCDENARILYANTTVQFYLGQSAKLLKDRSIYTVLPCTESWIQNYYKLPDVSYLVQSELCEMLRPPKEPKQVFVTCHPMADDPRYLFFEISPAAKALLISHERHMNELSENTRRLLRNLAHEIKNPLGGIRGAAQLLEGELSDPEQKEYTEVVISEADRLQSLVDKLLAPYRESYNPAPTNVHEVLERVRLLVEAEFQDRLRIVRDYDISAPEITADRGQLTQIFLNLMRNAAEALSVRMSEGTAEIRLKTRVVHHVSIGEEMKKTALNIHVIDNGEGIPQELLDSIFYPLVSGKEKGSGLGLSLVQSFVERHGGTISVSSENGKTDFSILFPLNAQ